MNAILKREFQYFLLDKSLKELISRGKVFCLVLCVWHCVVPGWLTIRAAGCPRSRVYTPEEVYTPQRTGGSPAIQGYEGLN